jgi:ABC-2 type transport system ATP-binding protein
MKNKEDGMHKTGADKVRPVDEAHPVVIQVTGLTKRYGPPDTGLLAVDHIDFAVQRGEIFGFLGPNGAGKTTTIRMLTGLTQPTAGRARVLGLDLAQHLPRIKKRIGVVPEASNLYSELTAFDNLVFSMQLYGVPRRERASRAEDLLARFRLTEKRDTHFGRLSRGMRRALTVAAALAHRPDLVFLDEPTTGLDVVSARNLRQMIGQLRDEGVTVFLTTHYLEEAERLCDRIALLAKGRIVALDTVEQLKAEVQGATSVEITLERRHGSGEQETRRLTGGNVEALVVQALEEARAEDQCVIAVDTVEPSLEDVFVQLTTEPFTGLDAVSDQSTSLDEVSDQSTPLDEVSDQSTPLDEVSDQSTPLDEVSDQSTPLDEVSDQSTPLDEVSDQSTPLDEVSDQSTSLDEVSDQSTSLDEVSDRCPPKEA